MNKPGPRLIIMPSDLAQKFYATPPSDWKTYHAHGFSLVKGKRADLTLLFKP